MGEPASPIGKCSVNIFVWGGGAVYLYFKSCNDGSNPGFYNTAVPPGSGSDPENNRSTQSMQICPSNVPSWCIRWSSKMGTLDISKN